MEPQIQYAKTSDGASIANYAIGQGPALLTLLMPMSHLEAEWQFDPLRMTVEPVQTPAAASGKDMFIANAF
jgi:hypothetical protein